MHRVKTCRNNLKTICLHQSCPATGIPLDLPLPCPVPSSFRPVALASLPLPGSPSALFESTLFFSPLELRRPPSSSRYQFGCVTRNMCLVVVLSRRGRRVQLAWPSTPRGSSVSPTLRATGGPRDTFLGYPANSLSLSRRVVEVLEGEKFDGLRRLLACSKILANLPSRRASAPPGPSLW